MTVSQIKVENWMNERIHQLKKGMHNLEDRSYQPDELGNLYNGMLKHSVEFEIQHMEHLRDELVDLLK